MVSAGFRVVCVDPAPPVTAAEDDGADLRTTAFLQPSIPVLQAAGLWERLTPHAAALQVMRIIDAGGETPEARLIKDFDAFESAEQVTLDRNFREHYKTGSCIIAPLMSGHRIIGVLNLADKATDEPFDDEIDLPPIEQLCELIGASIYNIELFECPLVKIQNTFLTLAWYERLLRLGSVHFATAGTGQVEATWQHINHPVEIHRKVCDAIERANRNGQGPAGL